MNIFIAGMTISGAGAGINELTALAVTSELAPTSKRGTYVGILVLSIIPFCPSGTYIPLTLIVIQHTDTYHSRVRPVDCSTLKLALDWRNLCHLVCHRFHHDCRFLLSSSQSQQPGPFEKGGPQADRLSWRITLHFGHDSFHDGHAVGRLPISLVQRSCPGPTHPRRRPLDRFRRSAEVCKESNVPKTTSPGQYQDPLFDIGHYICLGS